MPSSLDWSLLVCPHILESVDPYLPGTHPGNVCSQLLSMHYSISKVPQ